MRFKILIAFRDPRGAVALTTLAAQPSAPQSIQVFSKCRVPVTIQASVADSRGAASCAGSRLLYFEVPITGRCFGRFSRCVPTSKSLSREPGDSLAI